MELLLLRSEFTGQSYRWTVEKEGEPGSGKVISTSRDAYFVEADEGTYILTLRIIDDSNPITHRARVQVVHEPIEYSPYITEVYDYSPAPGQFVNMMPEYSPGDTREDMNRKALEAIGGTANEMVSLGAYGGYIEFGFDHTVVNVAGENDLLILGNAYYEEGAEELRGGSCEPGIVMVALDANGNGLPDDPWYELAGSDYALPSTLHRYSIRYSAPAEGTAPMPEPPYILDSRYIAWSDSEGAEGYVARNFQHLQPYWPQWIESRTLEFSGSRLAQNAVDVYGNGRYFRLMSLPWGYADNHPNLQQELCSFDIGHAVDSRGLPVYLPGINFVRVYTAVNQYCNWLGETSTEISHARDLHL